MHRSNYSRVESGERELSLEAAGKIAAFFGMTIDQLVNFEGNMPQEITVRDKYLTEKIKLIEELDEDDKKTIYNVIDKMLTNKKFKDFFKKNITGT
jgi:transcriptional regulator with XRE-family HTH domain